MTAYDLAGRPHAETVGARPPLTRDYDVFGHVTSLGLPAGVGAFGALFLPARVRARHAPPRPAHGDGRRSFGAGRRRSGFSWRHVGVARRRPRPRRHDERAARRRAPLRLRRRARAARGSGRAPRSGSSARSRSGRRAGRIRSKDAGIPLGDPSGKGSSPWGQFAYGYDGGRYGRRHEAGPRRHGHGPYDRVDPRRPGLGLRPRRLQAPHEEPTRARATSAASTPVRRGRRNRRVRAVQVRLRHRRPAPRSSRARSRAKSVAYDTGGDGRPDTRQIDPRLGHSGPESPVLVRRHEAPHLRRPLRPSPGTTTARSPRPSSRTAGPSKTANRRHPTLRRGLHAPAVRQTTSSSSRTTPSRASSPARTSARSRRGAARATGPSSRPASTSSTTTSSSPKSPKARTTPSAGGRRYVPGADLHDHVQVRVETYDTARASSRDRLYSYIRDEQGSVLALADETSDPAQPAIPDPLRLHPLRQRPRRDRARAAEGELRLRAHQRQGRSAERRRRRTRPAPSPAASG